MPCALCSNPIWGTHVSLNGHLVCIRCVYALCDLVANRYTVRLLQPLKRGSTDA
jgi:hypothetical protein